MQKSTRTLWLLFVVFVVPLLLAVLMYQQRAALHLPQLQHGHLLAPPVSVTQVALQQADNTTVSLAAMQGRWLMLYVAPEVCESRCQQYLHTLQQIHVALGKDQQRVRTLLVLGKPPTDLHSMTALTQRYPQIRVGVAQQPKVFNDALGEAGLAQEGHLFLVDPHGYMLMWYAQGTTPRDITKDLRRLLGVSHIG